RVQPRRGNHAGGSGLGAPGQLLRAGTLRLRWPALRPASIAGTLRLRWPALRPASIAGTVRLRWPALRAGQRSPVPPGQEFFGYEIAANELSVCAAEWFRKLSTDTSPSGLMSSEPATPPAV